MDRQRERRTVTFAVGQALWWSVVYPSSVLTEGPLAGRHTGGCRCHSLVGPGGLLDRLARDLPDAAIPGTPGPKVRAWHPDASPILGQTFLAQYSQGLPRHVS